MDKKMDLFPYIVVVSLTIGLLGLAYLDVRAFVHHDRFYSELAWLWALFLANFVYVAGLVLSVLWVVLRSLEKRITAKVLETVQGQPLMSPRTVPSPCKDRGEKEQTERIRKAIWNKED